MPQSWLGLFEQFSGFYKWRFCLTAAILAAVRQKRYLSRCADFPSQLSGQ
jgi:hypothetical protein